MTQPSREPPLHPRLLRVQLPWMKINADRLVFLEIKETYTPTCIPIRQKTEIRAACERRAVACKFERSHGKFDDWSRRGLNAERSTRCFRHAIISMLHREYARIVSEA